MNSRKRFRIKWEIAIGCLSIGAMAIYGGWLNGSFGNVPPYPRESRIKEENKRQDAQIARGGVHYPHYKWESKSLELLRNRLGWDAGKISIQPVAYMNGEDPPMPGHLPVFLVNDTDNVLQVPTQDGDMCLKLEVSLADGKWQRAQCHEYSFCGNSYGMRVLPAHSFVRIQGYHPTSGRRAKVRFAVHNGALDKLSSAEFEGLYSPDEVAMSAYDEMGLQEADLPMLRSFLLRKISPTLLPGDVSITHLRGCAWRALLSGRHDRNSALAVAKEVIDFDPTLETREASLGTLMGQWQAAMDEESRAQRRIHGFIISKDLVQNHAN